MHLGQLIDNTLISKSNKLLGSNTPFYITSVLDRAFKKHNIPVSFKFESFEDYGLNEFAVGGAYDNTFDKCFVVLHFSKNKKFYMSKHRWEEFKFQISLTCQHELIHKFQNQFREKTTDIEPLDFRSLQKSDDEDEEKDYLASIDEIDAYGHDIAMEIVKRYPYSDPYNILRTINKRTRIDAYNYYSNTFKDDDWLTIRKLLLKKAYKWLPHVTYTKG